MSQELHTVVLPRDKAMAPADWVGNTFGVFSVTDRPDILAVVRPVTYGYWFLPFLHAMCETRELPGEDDTEHPYRSSWALELYDNNWGPLAERTLALEVGQVLFLGDTLMFRGPWMHVVPPPHVVRHSDTELREYVNGFGYNWELRF